MPVQQGYIVATVCRALHTLATGEQTTKEEAVAWFAKRFPESARFVNDAYQLYLADVGKRHEDTTVSSSGRRRV